MLGSGSYNKHPGCCPRAAIWPCGNPSCRKLCLSDGGKGCMREMCLCAPVSSNSHARSLSRVARHFLRQSFQCRDPIKDARLGGQSTRFDLRPEPVRLPGRADQNINRAQAINVVSHPPPLSLGHRVHKAPERKRTPALIDFLVPARLLVASSD